MATIAEVRSLPIDPGRITAGAGAIALNAMLLMLLLVPIAAPPIAEPRDDVPTAWVPLPRPRPVPVPPVPVPVDRKPVTTPQPRPLERPVERPLRDTTDDPRPGDTVVPPRDERAIDAPAEPAGPADTGETVEGARLEYAIAPPPPYPPEALRAGHTGTVMLRILVDVDGRPLDVSIERGSGHRALDLAARRQVLAKWRFRPAMRDGQPVQAIGVVPVEFALD